jgi:hypothetical protein
MNRWVKTLVVSTYDRAARAVVVEQLIYVAAECRNLRNFNAVIEICLALKSTPIQRLTETWDLVSKQVRCAFSNMILHSRMPLHPTHVRLKLFHACDQ